MGGGFSTAKKVSVEPPSQNNVGVTAEDAANKAAAARKRDKKWKKGMNWRSPSGDTTDMPWKVYGGASIAPLLREDDELGGAPVALIDARFLVELARAGGRLIRRQDLPRGAFLDLATLRRMPGIRNGLRVLCVSYPWHTPRSVAALRLLSHTRLTLPLLSPVRSHPDPKGTTLQLLAAVLERFVADAAWDPAGTCAVFLDFCSLYQSDAAGRRTASEQILFDRGLKGTPCISELYSHQTTWILKVTTLPRGYPDGFDFSLPGGAKGDPNLASYYDRGWCFCESSMGNLVKSFRFVLDLARYLVEH